MKERKYRAWDKKHQRMIEDEQDFIPVKVTSMGVLRLNPHHEKDFWEFMPFERFDIMPESGLKCSKTGKSIYKGDFVVMHQFLFEGSEVENEIFGLVGYDNDMACFTLERIKNSFYENHTGYASGEGTTPICNFYGLHEESWTIVGDMYRSKELLTPTTK